MKKIFLLIALMVLTSCASNRLPNDYATDVMNPAMRDTGGEEHESEAHDNDHDADGGDAGDAGDADGGN